MAAKSILILPQVHHRTGSGIVRASPEHPGSQSGQDIRSQDATRAEGERAAKRIAIVDDEPDLSSLFSTVIARLGYRVEFVADSGSKVVQAVLEKGIHPDLILMDYRMPVMDGLQAAGKILEASPWVKIIIATADDSVRADVEAAGLLFIQKPFSIQALEEKIGEALGL